jgi:hypothetical protein
MSTGEGPVCVPPWWISTTIASTPCARSCGTSAFTVAASSLNTRPFTPAGVTICGVSFSVMPMKAILTFLPPTSKVFRP